MAKKRVVLNKSVNACQQLCPVCKAQCGGVVDHGSRVEHQCVGGGNHFWLVGDITNRLLRDDACQRFDIREGLGPRLRGKLL